MTASIWAICGVVLLALAVWMWLHREPKSMTVSERKSAELREKADGHEA